ncbi:MAG: stage III sporulation protein AA [bacterium]|jgi:stage III sporulation protein AA
MLAVKENLEVPLPLSGENGDLLRLLAPSIRHILEKIPKANWEEVQEIRLREGKPLMIVFSQKDTFVDPSGVFIDSPSRGYLVQREDMRKTIQLLSNCSIYSLEEELRQGFLTLRGGHRVGLVGKAVLEKGRVKTLKYIAGLNIRFARELKGVADKVLPYLINKKEKTVYHTLIVSPPQGGKTTILRDLARQLSYGRTELGLPGLKVGVVDERSEIAGCYAGVAQMDLGPRTDVLDGCPKAEGMMMLVRAMSPAVIVTDEIGREEDVTALEETLHAGVKLFTTAHGYNLQTIRRRPIMSRILRQGIFERIIILGFSRGAGTVESILDGETYCQLLSQPLC